MEVEVVAVIGEQPVSEDDSQGLSVPESFIARHPFTSPHHRSHRVKQRQRGVTRAVTACGKPQGEHVVVIEVDRRDDVWPNPA